MWRNGPAADLTVAKRRRCSYHRLHTEARDLSDIDLPGPAKAYGMTPIPGLFPDQSDEELLDAPLETAAVVAEGPFAGVALDQSIDRVLDYSIPKTLLHSIRAGQRVVVPLG